MISINFWKNFRAKKVSLSLLVFSSVGILSSFVSCTGYTKLNKKLDRINTTLEKVINQTRENAGLQTKFQQKVDEINLIMEDISILWEKYESKSASSNKKKDGFENFCYPSDCSIPYRDNL